MAGEAGRSLDSTGPRAPASSYGKSLGISPEQLRKIKPARWKPLAVLALVEVYKVDPRMMRPARVGPIATSGTSPVRKLDLLLVVHSSDRRRRQTRGIACMSP